MLARQAILIEMSSVLSDETLVANITLSGIVYIDDVLWKKRDRTTPTQCWKNTGAKRLIGPNANNVWTVISNYLCPHTFPCWILNLWIVGIKLHHFKSELYKVAYGNVTSLLGRRNVKCVRVLRIEFFTIGESPTVEFKSGKATYWLNLLQ